jgi:hypothetical protein
MRWAEGTESQGHAGRRLSPNPVPDSPFSDMVDRIRSMGPPIRLRRRLWLGGLAAGGVALAHVLAFMLAAPDPLHREELLETTGHGAWPLIVTIALGALVAALAGFATERLREDHPPAPATLYRSTAARLLLLQFLGFIVLESLERVALGEGLAGLAGLPGEPVIAIGLVVQVVVALAASLLLLLFARLLDRLARLGRTILRAPRVVAGTGVFDNAFPRTWTATGSANPRGPPQRVG